MHDLDTLIVCILYIIHMFNRYCYMTDQLHAILICSETGRSLLSKIGQITELDTVKHTIKSSPK